MIAVIDASVALKWQFEDEEATDSARALLDDFIEDKIKLIAPTLFPYEIISAINVAISRKRINESVGYTAIKYITSLGIGLISFNDLIETTFQMARQYGLSTYDCAYMALAEKEKCNLITGDKKFFNATRKHFPWVKLIGDYL